MTFSHAHIDQWIEMHREWFQEGVESNVDTIWARWNAYIAYKHNYIYIVIFTHTENTLYNGVDIRHVGKLTKINRPVQCMQIPRRLYWTQHIFRATVRSFVLLYWSICNMRVCVYTCKHTSLYISIDINSHLTRRWSGSLRVSPSALVAEQT